MLKLIIYAVIVFIANSSGASTGLGGGVVIKPLFDIVSSAPTTTINFYSSLAVFAMAVIALNRQLRQHFKFNIKILLSISIGSIIGGILGEQLLTFTARYLSADHLKIIQSGLLFCMLLSVILYNLYKKHLKQLHLQNVLLILIVGLGLGAFSVFLGIGGGPINVAIMMFLFSFPLREAAVYSVGIIFFAQFSKMITIMFNPIKPIVNLTTAIVVVMAAIIGGFIGAWINRKAPCRLLNLIYMVLLTLLLIVTFGNTLKYAGII